MNKNRPTLYIALVMVVVVGFVLAVSGPATAGDESAQEVKKVKKIKIKIKKKVDCEGEDCKQADLHRMIIENHGDLYEMHMECEGEECKEKMKVFVGRDGEMHKVHAMAGHRMAWDSEECEGEDCKQERRIVIRKGDGVHEIHGGGDFTWVVDGDGMHHGYWFRAGKGGFLGVQLTELTAELRTHFGVPADRGVMVGKVVRESAAETAGLQVGDIVTTVDGEPVNSADELSHAIRSREGGETVDIGIWRQGYAETVTAVLGESEAGAPHAIHRDMTICSEDDEDCDVDVEVAGFETAFDCGGASECEIEVQCEGGECTCTANGESITCDELNLPHHLPGE
jgi:membrane-associated protease RseP (regulator of RpoE activity)